MGNQKAGQDVLALLKNGASFEQIAESPINIDPDFYRIRGGDMGWVTLGSIGSTSPIWASYALQLETGQISPLFQIDSHHYYILQAIESPDYSPIPYQSNKAKIASVYAATMKQNAFKDMINGIGNYSGL